MCKLVLVVGGLVLVVDKRIVNCSSSFVTFEAAWYQPSLFDGCLVLRNPDIEELFRKAFVRGFSAKKEFV